MQMLLFYSIFFCNFLQTRLYALQKIGGIVFIILYSPGIVKDNLTFSLHFQKCLFFCCRLLLFYSGREIFIPKIT